jgi:hypothetical protein
MLLHELAGARLVEASSILELRLSPERLTGEIVFFIDECWRERTATPRRRASRVDTNGSATAVARRRSV